MVHNPKSSVAPYIIFGNEYSITFPMLYAKHPIACRAPNNRRRIRGAC
jgi:hypothetical protein